MAYLTTGATITQQKFNNLAISSKSSTYTAVGTDDVLLCTGTFTVTLYAANLNQDASGFQRPLMVVNAGSGIITVSRGGSDTFFDGNTSFTLNPGEDACVIPDGTSKWSRRSYGDLTTYRQLPVALTISSNTITPSVALANVFTVSLSANVSTITLSNWPANRATTVTIRFTQNVTGGFTVAFPGGWRWPGGTAPTVTATASKTTIVVLYSDDGGTTIYASLFTSNA